MMIAVGDLVTRKNDPDKIVFKVVSIARNSVLLKGEVLRLLCTSELENLVPCLLAEERLVLPPLQEVRKGWTLKGKVLHLDGDETYLKKALKAYRQYDVKAIGYYLSEDKMAEALKTLLSRHRPNIVVITGHDALEDESENAVYSLGSYRNSEAFVNACKVCRDVVPDLDSLVIIAGACQSYYEALIESGANFASSPQRENIHLLDPVIIASEIASALVDEYVMVDKVLKSTINKNMGGLDTKGQARRIYLGG